MEKVQCGDEELVGVRMLVPGEVVGVGPDHVLQLVGREGGAMDGWTILCNLQLRNFSSAAQLQLWRETGILVNNYFKDRKLEQKQNI